MHPILFKIGHFDLYTYGLMMALGVLTALFVMDSEAKRFGWNRDTITRMVVFDFLVGLAGARILYVLTRVGEPNVNIWSILFNARAGFVYYGGLISSWLYLIWFIKKHKLPFWSVQDGMAMAICIGLAVGRIGCLMGGCCYGTPTDLPWGVVMVNDAALGHLHPTQAYEFFMLVVFFAAMWWRRKHQAYAGELVVWFVGAYAIGRYVLEFWRGDLIRGFIIQDILSTSQAVSIPMLVVAIWLHFKLRPKKS